MIAKFLPSASEHSQSSLGGLKNYTFKSGGELKDAFGLKLQPGQAKFWTSSCAVRRIATLLPLPLYLELIG